MKGKIRSANAIQVLKKPLITLICLANIYILIMITLFSRMYPEILNVAAWLYDDEYVVENSLRYYNDFRPGYPPIGKIPIYLIYLYTDGNNLAIMVYNIVTFNISVIIFYYLTKYLVKNEISSFKVTALYILNPAMIVAILQPHADFLALSFTLMGIFFLLKKRILVTAFSIALGFLTKIYPAFLLIPSMIVVENRARLVLVTTFALCVWVLSLPFLISDPLMYLTAFVHHLYRGPSESIIAILDGYYGHTGFVHPLFDATIYYFQFSSLYQPSPNLHFYYAWGNPLLKYVALLLQLSGLIPLCLYTLNKWLRKSPVNVETCFNLSILSFFTFLALSPTQNILTHVPAYALACLLAPDRSKMSTLTIVLYAIVNGLHAISWTLFYQQIEFVLYVVTNLRVLVTALVFLLIFNRLRG